MATEHFDDPNILDEERLFRRIHLSHMVEGDGGKSEVSSAAFRDTELSVNLEGVMQAAGREPEDFAEGQSQRPADELRRGRVPPEWADGRPGPNTRGTGARLRIRQEKQENPEGASRRGRMDRAGRGAILGGDSLAEKWPTAWTA